ncbi:hypothetical protein ACHQM5_024385 [Ranunculus cassubicifolius]
MFHIRTRYTTSRLSDLDEDTLAEILCRLPVTKHMVSCKSVSKRWHNIISTICIPRITIASPVFGLLFNTYYNNDIDERGPWNFASINGYDEAKNYILVQACLDSLPFNPSPQELLDCFNGFILFFDRSSIMYCVCNPSTEQFHAFPKAPGDDDDFPRGTGLILHPNSQYGVVRICRSQMSPTAIMVNVFSPSTREWSVNQVAVDREIYSSSWYSRHVFLGGSVYILATSGHVLKFDVYNIGFQAIQLPDIVSGSDGHRCLGVSQGMLHYAWKEHTCKPKELYVWRLEAGSGHGNYQWFLKHAINLEYFRLHPLCTGMHDRSWFSVLAFHPTSDMLFVGNSAGIFCYDPGMNTLQKICILPVDERIFAKQDCVFPISVNLTSLDTVNQEG